MDVDILSKALSAEAELESLRCDLHRLEMGGDHIVGVSIYLMSLPSGENVDLNSEMSKDVVRFSKRLIKSEAAKTAKLLEGFGISSQKLRAGERILNEIVSVRMEMYRGVGTQELMEKNDRLERQLKEL